MTTFPHLFQPARIGNLELKNRLVMAPMATNYGSEEGFVTERQIAYYAARARGGTGLVVVEAACVDVPEGKELKEQLRIDDDRCLPGLTRLASAIKQGGAKAAIQIHHAGSETSAKITGRQPVAPSAIAKPGGEMPRALSLAEVERLIACFASAAKRVQKAGFDGVEVHGAHGYLIAQFLSSFFNKRTDAYGGPLEGRAKFLIEAIKAARKAVGPEYPVWCRLNGREFGPEAGLTTEEARQVARLAQAAGAQAIHVSVYAYGVSPRSAPPMAQPAGNLVRFAEPIKAAVTVPVIAVGRLDATLGEKVIAENRADLVAIGRGLIVDSEIPQKAAADKLNEIRPCIGCMTCLDCVRSWDIPMYCVVNPTAGKEKESVITRAPRRKKVLVVGGGPAGMEAARVAHLRGHDVVLYEKGQKLGGQLLLASVPPHKGVLETFAEFQRSQLARLGVRVELGREVNSAVITKEKPDAVILATGARQTKPPIPGVDRPNVVFALDILAGKAQAGNTVAVIGAELVACETAEFLADKGKKVTIMRRGDDIATGVNPRNRTHLLARLKDKGINILLGVQYKEINDQGVVITTKDGQRQVVGADTVVLAAGSDPEAGLQQALKGKVKELYLAGDCVKPRNLASAVSEGYFTALKV